MSARRAPTDALIVPFTVGLFAGGAVTGLILCFALGQATRLLGFGDAYESIDRAVFWLNLLSLSLFLGMLSELAVLKLLSIVVPFPLAPRLSTTALFVAGAAAAAACAVATCFTIDVETLPEIGAYRDPPPHVPLYLLATCAIAPLVLAKRAVSDSAVVVGSKRARRLLAVLAVSTISLFLFLPWMGDYLPLEPGLRKPGLVGSLTLARRDLVDVPEEVQQFKKMERVYLEQNRIRHLPGWLIANPRVRGLVLESNHLSRFPAELTVMRRLEELDLSKNEIAELPAGIGRMASLRWLTLYDNRLGWLPSEIGDLGSLESLNLDDNRLSRLAPEIGRLRKLRSLDLKNNRLTSLPQEIGMLNNVEYLDLDGNLLPRLPPEIGKLRKLKTLSVEKNLLTDFPEEMAKLTSLTRLNAGGNPVSAAGRTRLRRLLPHAEIVFGEADAKQPACKAAAPRVGTGAGNGTGGRGYRHGDRRPEAYGSASRKFRGAGNIPRLFKSLAGAL